MGLKFCNPLVLRLLRQNGKGFAVHLVPSVVAIYLVTWNMFHTPSHGPVYRKVHKVAGKVAYVATWVSCLFGFYVTWGTYGCGVWSLGPGCS